MADLKAELYKLRREQKDAVRLQDFITAHILKERIHALETRLSDIVNKCNHNYISICIYGMTAKCVKCGNEISCG